MEVVTSEQQQHEKQQHGEEATTLHGQEEEDEHQHHHHGNNDSNVEDADSYHVVFTGTLLEIKDAGMFVPDEVLDHFAPLFADTRAAEVSDDDTWKSLGVHMKKQATSNTMVVSFSRFGETLMLDEGKDWKDEIFRIIQIGRHVLPPPPPPPQPLPRAESTNHHQTYNPNNGSIPTGTDQNVEIYMKARVLLCQRRIFQQSVFDMLEKIHSLQVVRDHRKKILRMCAEEPFSSGVRHREAFVKAIQATKRKFDELDRSYRATLEEARLLRKDSQDNEDKIKQHVAQYGYMHKEDQIIALEAIKGVFLKSIER